MKGAKAAKALLVVALLVSGAGCVRDVDGYPPRFVEVYHERDLQLLYDRWSGACFLAREGNGYHREIAYVPPQVCEAVGPSPFQKAVPRDDHLCTAPCGY